MEYMENKMQDQYDAFDEKIKSLESVMEDIDAIIKKHGCDIGDIIFAADFMGKSNPAPTAKEYGFPCAKCGVSGCDGSNCAEFILW